MRLSGVRRLVVGGLAAAAAVGITIPAGAMNSGAEHAGPQGNGTSVTPVGYLVTPAGSQTNLGDLPLSMRLSPDGKTMLVSNDGQGTQSLQVVDPSDSQVIQTINYASPQSVFYGLAFSPDGTKAYASVGGDEEIRTYEVGANGLLTETTPISVSSAGTNAFPAGLAVTPDGTRLVVADHLADSASVVNLASGVVSTVAVGHDPLDVVVSPDGTTAYVTNQGADTVSVLKLNGPTPVVTDTITVGTHPNREVLDPSAQRLYVADGDSDQVSVIDTASDQVLGAIDLAPYPHANVGSNPDGLALSPDGSTLYVANSGNNDVDVIDVAKDQPRIVGSIPTAWYPSAVVATGSKLFVANAKGLGAGPNDGPGFPNPSIDGTGGISPAEYDASMIGGTLSTDALPLSGSTLAQDTAQVDHNDGFEGAAGNGGQGGFAGPIKHVIYVVRENRTYDQEFGSLGKGNGDPQLNLFGDDSATNSRALERQFVTLDNFYADAEVSAQGWNWDVSANSNPYAEDLFPDNYSGRNAPYTSESGDPAIASQTQANAYIWDRLASADVSFRNYGFYVSTTAQGLAEAADPVLKANTDHNYKGFDLNCPDSPGTFSPLNGDTCGSPRISEWLSEFNQYVASGNLPTVEFVRLPNDHTSGTAPGAPSAKEYVADNDWALGQLVDAVSHSPYWKDTAIFVTEDDAQNGPDHVDAHRTTSMVISPYTQTGAVDSTFYSTVSMLRTMEDIVGIRPMTQFDAYATPMTASFTNHPNFTPYNAARPQDSGGALQGAGTPMATFSSHQDPTDADQLNAQLLNQAIWKSVKGRHSTMPAPVHRLTAAPEAVVGG